MVQFKYQNGNSVKNGQITIIHASFPIEADIHANGWSFHIIVGKHKDGNYICIPNWSIGSELASLTDTFWNSERLKNYTGLNELNSNIIAAALEKISHIT